jgi:hypothetical protein
MYSVTSRRVRVEIVAEEKQYLLHSLNLRVCVLALKAICGSYSTYALKAYCTLTQTSSFIHLQKRCTHQSA